MPLLCLLESGLLVAFNETLMQDFCMKWFVTSIARKENLLPVVANDLQWGSLLVSAAQTHGCSM